MNRDNYISPNPKLTRYLLRIQQLMSSKSRSTSPLSSRISKVRRINSLEHYLKYQRGFKILLTYSTKFKKQAIRYFFNALLSLPEQKNQRNNKCVSFFEVTPRKSSIRVNLSVPTKKLFNLIKMKLKSNLSLAFILIKNSIRSNSYIDVKTSARSHQPKLISEPKKSHEKDKIFIILLKLYFSRCYGGFAQMKINKIRKQFNNKKYEQQSNNKNQLEYISMLQTMFLGNLFQKIKEKKMIQCFQLFKNNLEKQNSLKINKMMWKEKFINFSLRMFINNKNNIFFCFRAVKCIHQNSKKQRQQSIAKQRNKSQRELKNYKIYEASTIINKYLIKAETQAKVLLLSRLCLNPKKQKSCYIFHEVLHKKITVYLSRSFGRLKTYCIINPKHEKQLSLSSLKTISQIKTKKQAINWKTIGSIVEINKFFRCYLREPFDSIRKIKKKSGFQINLKMNQIAEESSQFKSFLNQSQIQIKNKKNAKQKQILGKTLAKILMLRIAEAFINIQFYESGASTNTLQLRRKSQWMKDVENFLIDRDRFNKSFMGKFNKIEQIINDNNKGNFTTPQSKKVPKQNGVIVAK